MRLDKRRQLLRLTAGLAAASLFDARGTGAAPAVDRSRAGFSATTYADAQRALGATDAIPSKDILIKAPDIAENGAAVSIEVTSRIADTDSISIIADKNPFPLVARFFFTADAAPQVATRIKLSESSNVRVIVRASGRHYVALREVKVTLGGCG